MISDKHCIQQLAAVLLQHGICDVILSPGSRNAPLITTFTQIKEFNCLSIVDERSAAFFALGMAQWKQKPVVICCTSGSAVLNYAPAISEAYYQKVPLIIITADRPERWIGQSDGQTIDQKDIYRNYIKKSFNIPEAFTSPEEEWYCNRTINEAINSACYPEPGPVHLNIPLSEPLYGQTEETLPVVRKIELIKGERWLNESDRTILENKWKASARKLIIVGQTAPDPSLNGLFEQLAQDPSVSILTETTSNIRSEGIHTSIDNILFTLTEEETKTFSPDILITFGGQIVSKRVKAFLRKNPPKEHWFFSISGAHVDTFQCLTTLIDTSPVDILKDLAKLDHPLSAYAELWQKRDELTRFRSKEYLRNCPFSDLTVFNLITEKIPAGYVVHTSNSTPVRYAQLVSMPDHIIYFANRGTSGIDGSVSTAAGSAYASKSPTLLITGDLSFFYDSNALWNRYLTSEFKIVLINNGGGGIFRIIEGPSTSPALEEYIETGHSQSARQLAEGFGVHYLSAKNHQETESALNRLFKEKGPALLEIFTTGKLNAPILNNYFSFLKTGTKDYLRIEI